MKRKITLFTILLGLLFVVGCAGSENGDAATYHQNGRASGELIIGRSLDSTGFDPQGMQTLQDALVWTQIYEGLVRMSTELEIEPALAHDWLQIDDYRWRFHLRDDVYFHNGDRFTAADVAFSIERASTMPTVGHIVGEITPTVEIIDDHLVEIVTTIPFAPFLVNLTLPGMSILNERAITEAAEGELVAIGTGPFKFYEWNVGDDVVLVRNDNYYGELAGLERLTFRFIPDAGSRMIALELGEIDLNLDLTPADIARVDGMDELNLIRRPNVATEYVAFNTAVAPFDNRLVRQAINYAINAEIMIETILEGVGGLATGPMNASIWAHNASLVGFPYNPERARALLAEAGLADGFSATIAVNSEHPTREDKALVIQSQLAQVGIEVEILVFENAAYNEFIDAGLGEMYLLTWTNVTADPENGLFPLFHSSRHGGAGNRTFFNDERVDDLLVAGRTAMDLDERRAIAYEAQEIIVYEAPWAFLITGEILMAAHESVEGFVPTPRALHFFNTTTVNR